MNRSTTVSLTAPRIVASEPKLIFGLSQPCPAAGDPAIPSLWKRFAPYIGAISGRVGNNAYGVIHNTSETGRFDYTAGVEVRTFPAQPGDFAQLRIPAQTYAVFEHQEHVSTVGAAWRAIWEHALSDAGFEAADGPAFELYGARFDPATGNGGLELWVPIIAPPK
ncbi:MAG: GyrI-like domain-containing protein [Bryobacteraceae bacterium]